MPWTLPPLPDRQLLADLCREAAERERVQPILVEKDFHLTRLLAELDRRFGSGALLKGGTLLSKVDLGFTRMSEDADLVIPGVASRSGRVNAEKMLPLRKALNDSAPLLGARIRFPAGERSERDAHVTWMLEYGSEFGEQRIQVEAAIRPVLRPSRRAGLRQLLRDRLVGDYSGALCHALDAAEARAEKVRAAFTREEARDFYDLQQLVESGADLTSAAFQALVDRKLSELGYAPLAEQGPGFALDARRRAALEASVRRDLPAVLGADAPPFDLDAVIRRFDGLWPMDHGSVGRRLLSGRARQRE